MKQLIALLVWCLVAGTFAALHTAAAQETRSNQAAPATDTYVVKEGDTLYRIATNHGMSVEQLKALNGLPDNTIRVGQEIRLAEGGVGEVLPDSVSVTIRDTTISMGRVRSYTVREGETLYSIAAAVGSRAYLLHALNGESRTPLEAGESLLVPAETDGRSVHAVGTATVFPDTYAGRAMAGGKVYDPESFVVSHPELPMGTILLMENRANGTATFAEVTDRGPIGGELVMEVSGAVAAELGVELEGASVHLWLVE